MPALLIDVAGFRLTSREFHERLSRRAHHAGISLGDSVSQRLEVYFRLLAAWNQKINLTALPLTDPTPETFDRLLVEPLVAATHLPSTAKSLMDIGSGGGSPAIPMAIAAPLLRLRMIESKTRKSVFLREAVRALGLVGAEVLTTRFEALLANPDLHAVHDVVTMRAVRLQSAVLRGLQALLKPTGQIFLFRGEHGFDPLQTLDPTLSLVGTYALPGGLPGQLIVLEKRDSP